MIFDPPLSNGTMGRMWEARWCEQCDHDHTAHIDEYDADLLCPVHNLLLLGEFPIAELTDHYVDGPWGPESLTCERFTPCTRCES